MHFTQNTFIFLVWSYCMLYAATWNAHKMVFVLASSTLHTFLISLVFYFARNASYILPPARRVVAIPVHFIFISFDFRIHFLSIDCIYIGCCMRVHLPFLFIKWKIIGFFQVYCFSFRDRENIFPFYSFRFFLSSFHGVGAILPRPNWKEEAQCSVSYIWACVVCYSEK